MSNENDEDAWYENKGVPPCNGDTCVDVQFDGGQIALGNFVKALNWELLADGNDITHYRLSHTQEAGNILNMNFI